MKKNRSANTTYEVGYGHPPIHKQFQKGQSGNPDGRRKKPAWILGHNPSAQIICASYAQDLADKHAIDCRALMSSEFYRRLFPATRLSGLHP